MIELHNLTVGYGEKAILSDINQTLEPGRLVCLLGSNGVGKSTILRTLAGFLQPLAGKVLLDGKDLSSLSLSQRSKTVSIVLTERVEVPYMKVVDLVGMGRSPYTGFFGKLSEEDKGIASDAIEQKAMLAKALAQQTPVILLDEPTAFLDFHAKISMLRLMQKLAHETNKIILMSTHDVEMALRLSDLLWIVQDGKIQTGTTASLTESGILRQFLGDEAISMQTRK